MNFIYKVSYVESGEEKTFYTSIDENITFNVRRDGNSNILSLVFHNDDLSSNNSLISLYDIFVVGKKTVTDVVFYLITYKDNDENGTETLLYSFNKIESLELTMNLNSNIFNNPNNDYAESNNRIGFFETNLRIG